MGSWTLRKMLFHMTVTDLVPRESWSTVFISPPAIGTAFVPRLSLNKQTKWAMKNNRARSLICFAKSFNKSFQFQHLHLPSPSLSETLG